MSREQGREQPPVKYYEWGREEFNRLKAERRGDPRYDFSIRFRKPKMSDHVEEITEELRRLGCTTGFTNETGLQVEQWSGSENDSAVRAILEDICKSEDADLEEKQKSE